MAMRTERIRLGAVVFAPSRRRPWKLAREAVTLDVLSGGRMTLPVGLGTLDDGGFGTVGEPVATRTRAELLDETLAIVEGLGSGESFGFAGRHYRFEAMRFRPGAVQRPRIPVWVVGAWPHERSLSRAIRWDGLIVQATGTDGQPLPPLEVLPAVVDWVRANRPAATVGRSFEIVVDGATPAADRAAAAAIAGAHERAGATWWLEADWANASMDALRERILAGPPRG